MWWIQLTRSPMALRLEISGDELLRGATRDTGGTFCGGRIEKCRLYQRRPVGGGQQPEKGLDHERHLPIASRRVAATGQSI